MSYIDGFDHEIIGTLGYLPIYHPLETIEGDGGWGAYDFSATPQNLVLGGGSGEHPGLVVHHLPTLAARFLLDSLTEAQAETLSRDESEYVDELYYACETLPSFAEIKALAALLQAWPDARAWFSFTLRDAHHLSDGTPLAEVVKVVEATPQIVALGINCIALANTIDALEHLHSLSALPLVVYPNSGETYDAVSKSWHAHGAACDTLAGHLPAWLASGAKLIGGCCRTTPEDIAALHRCCKK